VSDEIKQISIPRDMLVKIVNRRRRQVWWREQGAPEEMYESEQKLIDEALDNFCAWAEEHAPTLFYAKK
jgi:hypothetical protein